MTETTRLEIPLLASGQAQKHVTVNEGFARLDAMVQLALTSIGASVPPASPAEGEVHSIGAAASGDWAGQEGDLAIFQNGGWAFVTPLAGWQGWTLAAGGRVQFDGVDWVEGAGSLSANGAGFVHRTAESDHSISAGANSTLSGALPGDAVVYGITARVLIGIGGPASIEIGVPGSTDRYGSGIGTGAGAWARGITGSPLTYYSATDLLLTAVGGAFDGSGEIRVAVHYAELTLPRA